MPDDNSMLDLASHGKDDFSQIYVPHDWLFNSIDFSRNNSAGGAARPSPNYKGLVLSFSLPVPFKTTSETVDLCIATYCAISSSQVFDPLNQP